MRPLHRTAERAARAVYGTIIALADDRDAQGGSAGAGEIIVAVVGGVVAAQLAELYAGYLADVIREQRHPTRARDARCAGDRLGRRDGRGC